MICNIGGACAGSDAERGHPDHDSAVDFIRNTLSRCMAQQ